MAPIDDDEPPSWRQVRMMTARILGYLVWELAVLAAGCRLARGTLSGGSEETGGSRFLSLALVLDIVIAASIAAVVTAVRVNGTLVYLAIAALILATLALQPAQLRDDMRRLGTAIDRAVRTGTSVDRFLILTLGAAALSLSLRPVCECDSQVMLSYLEQLQTNRSHVHPTPNHYVVFWEMGYLPAMVLTRNDWFLWVTSLKPVVLAAVVLYRIGVMSGLSQSIAALAGVNAVLLCHYWVNCSGVATLKNDMVHAAGVTLIALVGLRVLRGLFDRETGVLMWAAAVFMTTKYSGLPELVVGIGLVAFVAARELIGRRWLVARWVGWSAAGWLLTCGHYYMWNLIVYRNPLFPFPVKFGPVSLPGDSALGELPRTTILSSIGDPRVWDAFFHINQVSVAGLWFPVTLALGLVAGVLVVARALASVHNGRAVNAEMVVLALLSACLWFLYFRSYWSAHHRPGDLFYLREHMLFSLRYAEAVVGLTELLLLALLAHARCSAGILRTLITTSMISRVAVTYEHFAWQTLSSLVSTLTYLVPASLVVLFVLALVRASRVRASLAAVGLVLLLVAVVPARFERYRHRYWYGYWREAWGTLEALPTGRVLLVHGRADFGEEQVKLYRYVVQGGRFDRDVRGVPEGVFLSGQAPRVDYVAFLRESGKGDESVLRDFDRRAAGLGYERIAGNGYCSLLRRVPVDLFARSTGPPVRR
jgi:hypothetical protein